MKSRIAGIVNDSIVDGPGIRCTIFFQGCTHNCEECHNKHTHDLNGGYVVDNIDILKKVEENPLLDGITFSGGEPLLQIESCIEIAKEVKKMGLDVVCYTGFVYEDALKIKGFDELKKVPNILSAVEMILIRLSYVGMMPSPNEILEKIETQNSTEVKKKNN